MKFNIEGEVNEICKGWLHLMTLCEGLSVPIEGGKFGKVSLNTLKRCLNSYQYMELYKEVNDVWIPCITITVEEEEFTTLPNQTLEEQLKNARALLEVAGKRIEYLEKEVESFGRGEGLIL
jgi:hypothetical protein